MDIRPRIRSGFTLIELLIVVCIVGILAGLVSSAVVKITRSAVDRKNLANRDRLQSAIMEYWHDMGRWPIDRNVTPTLKRSGSKIKDWQQDRQSSANKTAAFKYSVVFRGDGVVADDQGCNDKLVEKLLDQLLPDQKTRKTFIDLHGFYCPAADSQSVKWPATELVDAFDFYNGNATDEAGNEIPKKTPILSFLARFAVCPHCHHYYLPSDAVFQQHEQTCYYDGDGDGSPDCPYYEANNYTPYRFTKTQLEERNLTKAALPYTIEIDLVNNIVNVKQDDFVIR